MMKKMNLFILVSVAVLLVQQGWAASASQEHRGFFFSIGAGVSYMNSSLEGLEKKLQSVTFERNLQSVNSTTMLDGSGARESEFDIEIEKKDKFSGFGGPLFDMKLGFFIGRVVSLYSVFEGALISGDGSHFEENRGVNYFYEPEGVRSNKTFSNIEDVSDDAVGLFASIGVGFSVYPFFNQTNALNGLYLGFAWGFDGSVARLKTYSDNTNGIVGQFTRYEVGKDWWVSETWLLGVEFAFTKAFGKDDYDADGNRYGFGLLFRITCN